MILDKLRIYSGVVKFPHTVFALPFALTGVLLAAQGVPSVRVLFWVCVAMVGARSGAMAFNRWADARIDAVNPRTRDRPIPTGEIGRNQVLVFSLFSYALLLLAAYELNPLCFKLSPLAVLFTAFYSYTKRFTWASHLILGGSLSMAPIGGWIAVKGSVGVPALWLGLAVLFWVAGFDVLYALQDLEFDKSYGLYSVPALLGVRSSLCLARLFHMVTLFSLWFVKVTAGLGIFYVVGWLAAAMLLLYEHSMVNPNDLSKIDVAFFNMNGYISCVVFLFTLLDVVLWKR
jgi:4-hydroxybenzoate polyprenyltransferase